ncbi:hypothetical protein SHKM778_41790 [Streptomyces sp. KM77-8]|uniref:Uncharacterized protein n=1 Tax=Streptomyces haneummycinicus TaxID=3074435 RepID=A0AAT9HKL5_9ACTN
MHVALACLTADADAAPLPEAVDEVRVADGAVETVWADGARTRITFEPVEVRHTER